ncbi:MAG: NifU family protein [Burkholderiales bacterium]
MEPIATDHAPPFYTDDELDALYERDPMHAMRVSREQTLWQKQLAAQRKPDPDTPPPTADEVRTVLEKAREVLLRDGGDLELVEIRGSVVRVRMKGNCVGCPRATLDLKNVVEKTIKNYFPQITEVVNTF